MPSDFVYRAAKDITGFAIDRQFIVNELLSSERLADKIQQMTMTAYVMYQKPIFRQVSSVRRQHIKILKDTPGKIFFETDKPNVNACFEKEPSRLKVEDELE